MNPPKRKIWLFWWRKPGNEKWEVEIVNDEEPFLKENCSCYVYLPPFRPGLPTKDGWYWLRSNRSKKHNWGIRYVWQEDDGWYYELQGEERKLPEHFEISGPIPMSEEIDENDTSEGS